ncbi:hypothetical protein [Streptomyces clavifer]|uniref:hypothetical protein n=1 Tax=Streptomyces clavifer TaxID=68188 RepID=UPI00368DC7E4
MEIAELVLKYVEALVWPLVTVALVWGLRGHIREAIGRLTRLETPAGSMEFAQEARELLDEAQRLTVPRPHVPSEQPAPPEPARDPVPAPATDEDFVLPPPFPQAGGSDPGQPMPRWVYGGETVYGGEAGSAPEQAPNASADADGSDERGASLRMVPRRLRDRILLRELFTEAMALAPATPVGAVVTAWTTLEGFCAHVLERHDVPVDRTRSGAHVSRQLMAGLDGLGVSSQSREVVRRLRRLRDTAVHRPEAVTPEAARDFVAGCRSVASELQQYDRAPGTGPAGGTRTPPGAVSGHA